MTEQYHDLPYLDLVRDVMDNGVRKENRTGMDTFAVFSRQMRFDLSGGTVPMLTTKKIHTRSILHELLWYLRGDSNIKYLQDNGTQTVYAYFHTRLYDTVKSFMKTGKDI